MESSRRIYLYIKQKQGQDPFDMEQWGTFVQFGWVSFIMAEPFRHWGPHLNIAQRLRFFERKLTSNASR
jgi:hypothetical protein